VIFVDLHQPPRQLDGLGLAAHFDHRIPADQFLCLGEGPSTALIVPSTKETIAPAELGSKPPWSINVQVAGTLGSKLTHKGIRLLAAESSAGQSGTERT
jgi:hypothetical protein